MQTELPNMIWNSQFENPHTGPVVITTETNHHTKMGNYSTQTVQKAVKFFIYCFGCFISSVVLICLCGSCYCILHYGISFDTILNHWNYKTAKNDLTITDETSLCIPMPNFIHNLHCDINSPKSTCCVSNSSSYKFLFRMVCYYFIL